MTSVQDVGASADPGEFGLDRPIEPMAHWHGSLAHRMDGGPSGCPACGWRGVPTIIDGARSDVCPACEGQAITAEVEAELEAEAASKKLGRNDPCFCGSGKKWKRCHGR